MLNKLNPDCPICGEKASLFHEDKSRVYNLCANCELVFVPPAYHLSTEGEKKRYLTHNNDPHDPGYIKFLSPVAELVVLKHPAHSKGLDFGCGTGSPLPGMLEAKGMRMNVFDPFFAPHFEVFDQKYDFITCTEVMEHLRNPFAETARLLQMLNPGGSLYIKTELRTPERDFAKWHYIRDMTHISFFSKKTMDWMADKLKVAVRFPADKIIVFRPE